jgi:transposase
MHRELTDAEWQVVAPVLPSPRRMGRPRADDRKTLNGILHVLCAGCRWEDLPRSYGSAVTCWRRLRIWQGDGTWDRLWRALLKTLDERQWLDWEHTALDSSTVPATKGDAPSATQDSTG